MNDIVALIKDLGINPVVIIAIMFATAFLKSMDPKDRFKQGYTLFPLVSSLVVCKVLFKEDWFIQALIHAGLSAWFYDVYAKVIKPGKK
jgi:hypothetical protein